MTNLVGTVLGSGRYRLDSELGSGGQGVVFRGTHVSLNIPVAIKILSFTAAGDPALQTRFKREAQRTAMLRHPNIVTIHDYAFERGMYYIVSDFIEGTDLKKLLKAKPGPMPLDQVVAYVRQVADGLDYAHRQNIIHRDIKPGNILIDRRDGRVVLVDFGLARMMENEDLSVTSARGGTPGTPAYMSPEQITGEELDQRTDVYSVAVVVYEMVTGRSPFSGEHDTTASILYKQVHEPPPPPRSIVPSLSPQVEGVMLKALAKDPDERYQTVGRFVDALENARRGPRRGRVAQPSFAPSQCPRCGATLPAGTKFCGACGASVVPQAEVVRPRPALAPRATTARPSSRAPSRAARLSTRPRTPTAPPSPRTGPRAAPPPPARARPAAIAPAFEFKGVGARLGAALIDGVLLAIGFGLVYIGVLADFLSELDSIETAATAEAAIPSLLTFAYYVLFEGWFGGTLGKLILGMRVVDKTGKRAGIGRAFLRNLLRILDFLPVAYLLGIIMVAASSTKQRLGDRLAGTYVVSRRSLRRR